MCMHVRHWGVPWWIVQCTYTTSPHRTQLVKAKQSTTIHSNNPVFLFCANANTRVYNVHARRAHTHTRAHTKAILKINYRREYQQWNIISCKTCKIVSHTVFHIFCHWQRSTLAPRYRYVNVLNVSWWQKPSSMLIYWNNHHHGTFHL